MDPHLLILLLCLGLLLLAARAARRILYRACVPRSPALRRTSWRDLCLLRSDRLSDWPVLEAAFEISRLEWLAIHGAPPIVLRPEVRCAIRVPPVLVDHSQLCLQDLADVERQNVMWQSFSFFNALFFHGQLQVDDIRFRASVPGSLDAAEGAEAARLPPTGLTQWLVAPEVVDRIRMAMLQVVDPYEDGISAAA